MKIALSGLHSQGKTTLLNSLTDVDQFKTFTKVSSPTRTLQQEGFTINEQGNETTQTLIMMQHYKNVVLHNKNAIFDRCALDGIAYGLFFSKQIHQNNLNKLHEELFLNTIKHYDIIFYIEPELELKDDNTRSLDINFFNNVKLNFENVIQTYNLNVLRVKGSIQERVDFICNAV